jgi:23S rRNA G2069 N7-methylase RlmK/C1962 C5-methylase RlmI
VRGRAVVAAGGRRRSTSAATPTSARARASSRARADARAGAAAELSRTRRGRFASTSPEGTRPGFYLDQRDARRAIARVARPARAQRLSRTRARSASSPRRAERDRDEHRLLRPALELARATPSSTASTRELIEADAFTALRALRDRARQYDMILLDPHEARRSSDSTSTSESAYKDTEPPG